jgi:hypothetical protein
VVREQHEEFSPLAVAGPCVVISRYWYLFKRLTAVLAGRFYRFEHIVLAKLWQSKYSCRAKAKSCRLFFPIGRSAFTERDWLFLFGHPREKVLSLHLWLRFAVLWFAVVAIGFVKGYVLLRFGLAFPWGRFSHRDCSLACCAEVAT